MDERSQPDEAGERFGPTVPPSPGRRRGRRRDRGGLADTETGITGSVLETGESGSRLPLDARLALLNQTLGEVVTRLAELESTVDVSLASLADGRRISDAERRDLLAETAALMADLVSPRFTAVAVQLSELAEAQSAALTSADVKGAAQLVEVRTAVDELASQLGSDVREATGSTRGLLDELGRALTTAVTHLTGRLDRLGERADQLDRSVVGATETTAQTLTDRFNELHQRADATTAAITGRLDRLGERADQLDRSVVGATETTSQALTDRFNQLDQHADATTAAITGRLDELAQRLDQHADATTAAITGRLDELTQGADATTAALTGRLDRLAQRLDQRADATTAAITGRLDRLAQRLDQRADATTAAITGRLDELDQRADATTAAITGRLDELDQRADATTAAITGRLDELAQRADAATAAITGRLDELAQRADATTAAITGRLDELAQRVDQAGEATARRGRNDATQLAGAIGTTRESLEGQLAARFADLSSALDGLTATAATRDHLDAALRDPLGQLVEAVHQHRDATAAAIDSRLDQVAEQLEQQLLAAGRRQEEAVELGTALGAAQRRLEERLEVVVADVSTAITTAAESTITSDRLAEVLRGPVEQLAEILAGQQTAEAQLTQVIAGRAALPEVVDRLDALAADAVVARRGIDELATVLTSASGSLHAAIDDLDGERAAADEQALARFEQLAGRHDAELTDRLSVLIDALSTALAAGPDLDAVSTTVTGLHDDFAALRDRFDDDERELARLRTVVGRLLSALLG